MMKTIIRTAAVTAALVLLLSSTAGAVSAERDLYAPMECEAGEISLYDVVISTFDGTEEYPYPPVYLIYVQLSVPPAMMNGVTDPAARFGGAFTLVNADGEVYYPEMLMQSGRTDTIVFLALGFMVPIENELADCRFVFAGQARMLAVTGSRPEPSADAAAPDETQGEPAAADEDTAEADGAQLDVTGVLDALGEPAFGTVYASLAEGNVIRVEDRSEAAKGLQALLSAFGYGVTADGYAGPQTFAALHQLQAAFGMEETDSVDAAQYARLLSCLLIHQDRDAAESLLAGGAFSESEYNYLSGCAAAMRGLFYTASDSFYESDWKDAKDRAQACRQPWPETGETYHNEAYVSSQTTLHIVIEHQDENEAIYIKIFSGGGDLVAVLFAGGSGTVTTDLPGGVYSIKTGTGKNWYGPRESFGKYGYYETLLFGEDETEVALDSGYEYTLTLNTYENDPEADDVDAEDMEWDAF